MNKAILLIFSVCISISAQASLISADDPSFGSNTITSDSTSGFNWLDLTFSKGYSYSELITETSLGGIFDGFHLASITEVQTLFDSAMLPTIGSTTTDFSSIDALIDLIGATRSQDAYLETLGITATAGASGVGHRVTGLDFFLEDGEPLYAISGNLTYGDTFGPDSVGGWLVRDAAEISEPATILLMMIAGLFVLFAPKRSI